MVFNLQLTIQKLEEELTYRRNGTTTEDLLEFIREKDHEIVMLKESNKAKDDTLRKIAKSSNDVLAKYEHILEEKNIMVNEMHTLKGQVRTLQAHASDFKARYDGQETEVRISFDSSSKLSSAAFCGRSITDLIQTLYFLGGGHCIVFLLFLFDS